MKSLQITFKPSQYNAALAVTGAINRMSKEKLYNELRSEYLKGR